MGLRVGKSVKREEYDQLDGWKDRSRKKKSYGGKGRRIPEQLKGTQNHAGIIIHKKYFAFEVFPHLGGGMSQRRFKRGIKRENKEAHPYAKRNVYETIGETKFQKASPAREGKELEERERLF